jgi:hypothetical protein
MCAHAAIGAPKPCGQPAATELIGSDAIAAGAFLACLHNSGHTSPQKAQNGIKLTLPHRNNSMIA